MFASLPMYDRPQNRAAHDALWSGVQMRLGYGPPTLCRETDYIAGWGRADLLLGQMCNLPYAARYKNRVLRIGCSDYGLPDTPAGYYYSVFVVRREDAPRGLAPATLGRFAYNDAESQSGWGAPFAVVSAMGLRFHTTLRTGAHYDSMMAVAQGRADLAAIDAVSWRMFCAWEPAAALLQVVGRTGLSPGMTFITGPRHDPAVLRDALSGAIGGLAAEHAAILGLRGIIALPDAAYDIPMPARPWPSLP